MAKVKAFRGLRYNQEEIKKISNETCKKFASSEACFSISPIVNGWPMPVNGISPFPLNLIKRVLCESNPSLNSTLKDSTSLKLYKRSILRFFPG